MWKKNVHRDGGSRRPFLSSNNVKVGANSRLHCWFSNDFFFFSSILGVGLDDGKDRFVGDIRHARRNDRSKRLFFRIAILSANCSDCVYTAIFARTSLRSIISYNGTIYGGDGEIFWNFIAVESWREIYATWNRKYNTTSLLRFHFREINNCERHTLLTHRDIVQIVISLITRILVGNIRRNEIFLENFLEL